MKSLAEFLNFCQPATVAPSEHEQLATRAVRSLTVLGFEAYDVWCIAELMLEFSLNPADHPEMFPPNQRPTLKRYPA